MKMDANTPCSICGSCRSEPVFEKQYPEFAYPGTFSICRCEGCGLLFNSPRLCDNGIRDLYGRNYYFFQRSDAREFKRIVDMYQRTVALVEDKITDRRVLEIGSAKGYLLAVMRRLGWDVRGIEVSRDAAKYANKKIGVDSFTGTLEEYAASAKRAEFPLVLAIDLIEHVLNPDVFVSCLGEVVTHNGIVVIDTPNGKSHNISVKGCEWKGFNPFHIFLFSRDNITTLLQKHGFEVEKIFSYGNTPEDEEPDSDIISGSQPAVMQSGGPIGMVKSMLKRAHLFDFCLRICDGAVARYASICKTDLKNAIGSINDSPDYLQTSDSTGPLSENCRGDNLVVFARKSHI